MEVEEVEGENKGGLEIRGDGVVVRKALWP